MAKMNRKRWACTRLAEILDIAVPIIQAPMAGGVTTPELVAAVSNVGGLGSLGAALLSPERIAAEIAAIRALTAAPFNVNLFVLSPPRVEGHTLTEALCASSPCGMNSGCPPATFRLNSVRVFPRN